MPLRTNTRELSRYLASGLTAVLVDLSTYFLLLHWLDHNVAKGLSFIAGTLVAYLMNKFWTFQRPQHSWNEILKFSLLYLTSLGINILVNHEVILLFHNNILGFLCATGASTVLNFVGQKLWVFPHRAEDTTP